jgi:anti-anti-sigma factor
VFVDEQGLESPPVPPVLVTAVTSVVGGVSVVGVAGEVDSATERLVREEVLAQLATTPAPAGGGAGPGWVSFLASAGLAMLLELRAAVLARGAGFAVAARHRAVVRTLQVTELDTVIGLYADVEEVLARLPHRPGGAPSAAAHRQ